MEIFEFGYYSNFN